MSPTHPDEPSAIVAWAEQRLAGGPDDEVLAALAAAAGKYPDHALLAVRHADALHHDKQLEAAEAEYGRALALDPALWEAWYGRGCAALARQAFGESARCLERAVALRPELTEARYNLARARFELGEADAALAAYRAVVASGDERLIGDALLNIASLIPGADSVGNAEILAARRQWAEREEARIGPRQRPATAPGDRLKVGYVSAFFGERNWMKPVWGAVNHHDRERFELHFFADRTLPTAASGYRDFPDDRIHEVTAASNGELADYIAGFGIDLLVDLNGYSLPARLGLFMRRPAPVIAAWFNMYATTGIDSFDYVIADAAVLPPEEESFCTERVLRVPGSYLAFDVPYVVPEVAPPPVVATGVPTFGSFCSQYKITDWTVEVWAAILAGAPAARLLLKNRTLDDASSRAALLDRFARHGIAADRLLLDGSAEHADYLAAYDRVDIALDTFPYSGGTTTMEALWQGVPVLTCDGDRWAARTSKSLLLAAGLDDWCLPNHAALVERAVGWARRRTLAAELSWLRATMRQRLKAAPVMDGAALCRALEAHYLAITGSTAAPPA